MLGFNAGDNALRRYGIVPSSAEDRDERGERARKSIDAGVPVLSLGSRGAPEWGVILGYEVTADGYKYFGRSYFDGGAPENELFTENRYTLGNLYADYHMLLDGTCEATPAMDALKISLEAAVKMFAPHDRFGYGAYDTMIKGFETNTFMNDWGGEGDIYNIIINLTDARRAAQIYLNENASLLSGENKSRMLSAAAVYGEMIGILLTITEDKDFDGDIIKSSRDVRIKFAGALQKCKELEYRAQDIIKNILENWEG